MFSSFLQSAAAPAAVSGALAVAAALLAVSSAAAESNQPIEIREWEVPYDGRPRDPFAAGEDEIWFVGQVNGYLGRLTPSSGVSSGAIWASRTGSSTTNWPATSSRTGSAYET